MAKKWSLISRSFKNRSANNIKNRWYYFLCKKVEINHETRNQFPFSNPRLKNNKMPKEKPIYEENKLQIEKNDSEKAENDDLSIIFQQENEFLEIFNNNTENDNCWLLYN